MGRTIGYKGDRDWAKTMVLRANDITLCVASGTGGCRDGGGSKICWRQWRSRRCRQNGRLMQNGFRRGREFCEFLFFMMFEFFPLVILFSTKTAEERALGIPVYLKGLEARVPNNPSSLGEVHV